MAAHITIPDTSPRVSYTATSGQTAFAIPFPFFLTTQIAVWVNGEAVLSGFTITGTPVTGGFSGGTLTFSSGRTLGDIVVLIRQTTIARTSDFPFPSPTLSIASLNTELDRIFAIEQEQRSDMARMLRAPDHESPIGIMPDLATRADHGLGFDGDGNPVAIEIITTAQLDSLVATATTKAAEATAAAATAATDAGTSSVAAAQALAAAAEAIAAAAAATASISTALTARLGTWTLAEDGGRSNGNPINSGQLFFQREGTGPGDRRGAVFRIQGECDAEDRVGIFISNFSPDTLKFPIVLRAHVDDGVRTAPVPVGANRAALVFSPSCTLLNDGTQGLLGTMRWLTNESPLDNGGTGCGSRLEINLTRRGAILPGVPRTMEIDPDLGVTFNGVRFIDGAGNLPAAAPPVNYLANPAFLHWQAGTSFVPGGTTTHLADRWKAARAVAGITYSRQAGFSGAQYCIRMQRDNGDSSTSSLVLFQHFSPEKVRQLAGRTLLVSFDARCGADYSGGVIVASFYSGTAGGEALTMIGGSAGFPTGNVAGGNIDMGTPTTTAARLSGVAGYAVPADARDLAVRLFWTPANTAGAADYVEITNVQVATGGTTATPYDLTADLAECLRFYRVETRRFVAVSAGATTQRASFTFETPMRATPSTTLAGEVQDVTAAAACSASAASNVSAAGFDITCTGNASTAVGNLLEVGIALDARL